MTQRLIHIPTFPSMGRSLIHHDERSKEYPARTLMKSTAQPRNRLWRRGRAYDQDGTSTCVAQTGKGMLNTLPLSSKASYYHRSRYSIDEFYAGARELDEWPGVDYEGTSGLGLCKHLKLTGKIDEYRWCFGLNDVLLTLSHIGPVGLGIWWYSGMYYTDEKGEVQVTGSQEGGHEVELIGVDVNREQVVFMNSWGPTWGEGGRGRLSWTNLYRLLEEQGDAFVILK